MRRSEIPDEICALAFDFFYWFSRFEFALKENGYLKSNKIGAKAEVSWQSFIEKFKNKYLLQGNGVDLIDAKPRKQIVGRAELDFIEIERDADWSNLEFVIILTKTVRNNLFHGGKHDAEGWDDPERVRRLLTIGLGVLNELAGLGDMENDYTGYY